MRNRQQRGWVLIAVIAIGFAVLLMVVAMLVPHSTLAAPRTSRDSAASPSRDYLPAQPAVAASLCIRWPVPQAPVMAAAFQRPPPSVAVNSSTKLS